MANNKCERDATQRERDLWNQNRTDNRHNQWIWLMRNQQRSEMPQFNSHADCATVVVGMTTNPRPSFCKQSGLLFHSLTKPLSGFHLTRRTQSGVREPRESESVGL